MNIRDKSILTGLYLSKYNEKGLKELGFNSYQEAFNVLGFSLGGKPASIKNYRDEFDPLFPNQRKGWYKRPIRDYCENLYNEFNILDFKAFSDLIKSFYVDNFVIEKFLNSIEKRDYSESVAKRLLTGKAAEEYFKSNYKKIDLFSSHQILDTTNMACGFDYKLTNELNNYFCIEVKGLNELTGNIQLTEKEFSVAQNLTSNYCLFIVKNFKEKPIHDIILDPLNSRLKFSLSKRDIVQINYNASI